MEIEIRELTPDLEEAYFDFFDHRAFSDGSPYYPCYCNAFNMDTEAIKEMHRKAKLAGGRVEDWKNVLRETAIEMVREGRICGYLAFDKDIPVGWCNANDRMNYFRTGAFDLDQVTEDSPNAEHIKTGEILSVVCFAVSPEYRGKGIASRLLDRVISDAEKEGYRYVEAYPSVTAGDLPAFTGPLHLYEKAGFTEYSRHTSYIVMRKQLFQK